MPLFYLELFCELENLTKLVTSKVRRWEFSVRCTHCNEEHAKNVVAGLFALFGDCFYKCFYSYSVSKDFGNLTPIPGSRGEAHIVVRCRQCEVTQHGFDKLKFFYQFVFFNSGLVLSSLWKAHEKAFAQKMSNLNGGPELQ
jgi:hypothetical protein